MKLKLISCILLFSTIFAFANELDLNDFEEEYQSYKVNDPLYGYNKAMTSFNVALYDYSLRPILKGYNAITPEFIRTGVRNFDNLFAPLRFVGNVLQFKFEEAGEEFKDLVLIPLWVLVGLWILQVKWDLKNTLLI